MSSRPIIELTEGQAALRRFMALGAALVVLVLIGVTALLAGGSYALDDLQAREDRARVGSALERSLRALVGDVTTATAWNQAYEGFRPGGDLEWADEEIGSYFASNRGHDLTVAIDGLGRPFYAWAGDARVAPSSQDRFLADAAPLVRRVRALALHDAGGRPVGWISWTPKRPGLRVLKEAAPVVLLRLLAVGGVMAALGLQILRVARRLGAHERDLTA